MQGRWKLTRTIKDYLNNAVTTGKGVATFLSIRMDQAVLHYREDLKVFFSNGVNTDTYREYLYKLEEGKIKVYFQGGPDTGKFFHELTFTDKTATGEHLCVKDDYKASYVFHSDHRFDIVYQVDGPKKNYESKSQYTRE